MDISCDIIRDILPLYAENMVSDATRNLVDGHLCNCGPCTKELEALKKETKFPMEVETGSLQKVEHTIRRRKILTVAAVVMMLVSLVVTVSTFLFTPYLLTAEEAIEGVERREDGGLAIDYARGITGMGGRGIFDVDNYGHICHTNRYDWYQAKQQDKLLEGMSEEEVKAYIAEKYQVEECSQKDWDRFFDIRVEYGTWESPSGERFDYPYIRGDVTQEGWKKVSDPTDRNHWYLNPETGDGAVLLWDGGKDMPTSIIWLTNYAYGYLFWGCLILAAVCYLIARKSEGFAKEILTRGSLVLGCISASTLLVTGGKLTTLEYYMSHAWTEAIYMEAMVLTLTALLWHQLFRLNRQDRGL